MENTRADKLKDNIEEFEQDISKLQVVISGLEKVEIDDNEIKSDLKEVIKTRFGFCCLWEMS